MIVSQLSTSITFNWTQPVGETVDNYEITVSYQGPCSGFTSTNTVIVDGATREQTLTGLQEFSTYTIDITAVNCGGRSETTSQNVTTAAAGKLYLTVHRKWQIDMNTFLSTVSHQLPLLHLRQSVLQPLDQKVSPSTGIMFTALNVTVKSQDTPCTTTLLVALQYTLYSWQTPLPTLWLDWLPLPTTLLRWRQ